MQHALIRILPVGLTEELPEGWDKSVPGFLLEVIETLQVASNLEEIVNGTEPDVVLIDTGFGKADGFDLARRALATAPHPAVIILSKDADGEMRRAMLSGAEELLEKPLNPDDMHNAIITVASKRNLRQITLTPVSERAPETKAGEAVNMNGIIVGVAAGKGGLGKTTIASNLALLAAKTPPRSAAFIGLEAGDGAILLNLQPKLGLIDLAAGEEEEKQYSTEWIKQFATPHKTGLQYWTWQGSNTRSGGNIPEDFLQRLFPAMRQSFAVTIVDLPLLSPEEVPQIMPLLDTVVVVSSTSDLLALRSTKAFLDLISVAPPTNVHVVINRVSSSDMISQTDFETMLNRKVVGSVSNEPALTAEAINMGAPVVSMQTNSSIVNDLRNLGQATLGLAQVTNADQKKKLFGLFG